MRRGLNSSFLVDDNGMVGVNLGSDFCAEHEWGINSIKKAFDLKDDIKIFGVKKRIINKIPKNLIFKETKIKNKKYFVLILFDDYCWHQINENNFNDWIPSELMPYGNQNMKCAWDEKSFGILVTKKYKKEIKELYQAFLNKNIAIGVSPSHAFKNSGLIFSIASKLPKKIIDNTYEKDKDYYELQKAAKATGIYKILEKAEKGKYKGWMALSPRWKNDDKKEVIFWLNPEHQNIYNYGWYTVKDLKEWAKDKGRIMKINNKK